MTAPDRVEIVRLQKADHDLLGQVEELFVSLYEELDEFGLNVPLAPAGARIWREGVESTLGRLGHVSLAVTDEGRAVGFVQTALAVVPQHLQGKRVAKMLNVYVTPEARGSGIVRRLVSDSEDWAREKGAESIEVVTQTANKRAAHVYERFGFTAESLQLRKIL